LHGYGSAGSGEDFCGVGSGDEVEKKFVFASEVGEGGEMFDDGGLEIFFEEGDQFFTDAGARFCDVEIGGIFAPRLFFRAQVGAKFGVTIGSSGRKTCSATG
jgi:hypothetical protein